MDPLSETKSIISPVILWRGSSSMHFNQKSYYKYKTSQSGQKYKFHYICIGLIAIVSPCFVNFRLVEDSMQMKLQ